MLHQFQIILNFLYVCQSVSWLTLLLKLNKYQAIRRKYLSEYFWRYSQNIGTLVPINYKFLVCLSVCQLAYFITEIRQIQGYIQFCMRYLSENFLRHFWDVCTLVPNNLNFLYVCRSVSWLSSLLKLCQCGDISSSR